MHLAPIIPAGTIEIAWRILLQFQRKDFAFEAANHILNDGFTDLNLETITAFTAKVNLPSIGLMQKLNMQKQIGGDFQHPKVPDSHGHLKHHVIYTKSHLCKSHEA